LSIRDAWEESLLREGHVRDPAQERMIEKLEALAADLERADTHGAGWLQRLFRKKPQGAMGLYLWGDVGRGKTFLMDLFFEQLAVHCKKRIHFHRMMRDVHERLRRLRDVSNPLDEVAAQLAGETRVLCFDEFFVSDIGDAMILGGLLDGLFRRGVTLVATSNTPPAELYRDGLQRSRFVPAIALLEEHMEVLRLGGDTDYRLRLLERAGTYMTPADESAARRIAGIFDESASSEISANRELMVNSRGITAHRCAKGIAWFDFDEICGGPRSQSDYIEIARWYPTVIVSGVPRFDKKSEDEARRFIALVDEFYDRKVKLIVSAAADPAELYRGRRLDFEFERTRSRLVEMQTHNYLALPHLA
jgi:cell division protein ZapE